MTTAAAIDLETLARVGKALSDETRRRILVTMLDGPTYPADLVELLGAAKASISNHLSCLRGCGIVTATPEGRRVRYELADPRLAHALADLAGLSLHISCEPGDC